eukprot:GEMP01048994.1.p1 GENE.GEMP01048994.1~~GEMP01048994.1.p1  ORF type:complete len:487 (+),score=124.58 GEMP01048994.1:21-1481(+)
MTDYEKWSKFQCDDDVEKENNKPPDCSELLKELPQEVPSNLRLCLAGKEKRFQVLEELLKNNADPNDQDPHGRTPLHLSISQPYSPADARPLVEALLSSNASVNIAADNGDTPLSLAATIGHEELMDALLDCTLNKTALDHALFCAAKSSMCVMSRRILAKHASPWAYRADGNLSCLHYWSAQGDLALMQVAMLHEDFETIDCTTNGDITPLHVALRHADLPKCTTVAGVLIDAQADVNKEAMNGETPLNMCRSLEATAFLVQHGADVNHVPRLQQTALVSAFQGNRCAQAEFLVKEGKADPNIGGLSPLMAAIRTQSIEDVRLLLNAKALPNKVEEESGALPLVIASSLDDADIVGALLAAGADANLQDHNGFPALLRTTSPDIARLLLQTTKADTVGAGKTALVLAAGSGNVVMCELLMEKRADINKVAPCTALIAACASGQESTCKLLLERGANKDIIVDGISATQIAKKNEFPVILEMLAEY